MNAQGRKRKVAGGDADAVPESEASGGETLNPRSACGFQVRGPAGILLSLIDCAREAPHLAVHRLLVAFSTPLFMPDQCGDVSASTSCVWQDAGDCCVKLPS